MRDSEVTLSGRRRTPAGRAARLAATAAFGAVLLLAAACSGGGPSKGGGAHGRTAARVAGAPAQISITPGDRTRHARPNRGVAVTVAHGKLRSVSVVAGHDPLAGLMSNHGTTWHTLWPLHTATHYTVTATAIGTNGKPATATSSFRTLTPQATFSAQTVIAYNQTYGVGMPITILFSQPVVHRAQVERAISITSSNPVVGAFEWDSSNSVSFRPRDYWPAHTNVSFVAHFNGVEIAPGVYGTANLSQSFHIGNSLIGVTNTRTHHSLVYYKGKLIGRWPDSSGRPGDDTPNCTYLTINKGNPVLMSGPGYKNVPVYWSVRFPWSGDYWHDAPWSLSEQGLMNVSHGCVNLSPQHAQWYYQHEVPGDPITVVGSPVAGQPGDGWTQWFLSWKQMLQRSATHLAVKVGPSGSTLVDPATLPATTSHSVLVTSQNGNNSPGRHPA